MQEKQFIQGLHKSTARNYIERGANTEKARHAEIAKKFDFDYWDGDRKYGYGGYSYDGRWREIAKKLIETYHLGPSSRVLDIGCGKGYLLYEIMRLIPDIRISGIDISTYALTNAKEEVKRFLKHGDAKRLDFPSNYFDLIVSNCSLHNLEINNLFSALSEIVRVKKIGGNSWICVESYRNEQEKINMINWQLTCESFFNPDEWRWIFEKCEYDGDYEFIYFE